MLGVKQEKQIYKLAFYLYSTQDPEIVNKLYKILIDVDRRSINNLCYLRFPTYNTLLQSETYNKTLRVAFSGKMTSGKTTCMNIIKKYVPDISTRSFAEPLKWICISLFGMSSDPIKKDRILLNIVASKLQEIDYDVFTKMCLRNLVGNIVIDDLRFRNEVLLLKEKGFYTIRLNIDPMVQEHRIKSYYPDTYEKHLERRHHQTEIELDCYNDFNYTINSHEYTLEQLDKRLKNIIEKFSIKT